MDSFVVKQAVGVYYMIKELTYSVIVSEDHPNMPKTVTEAYRVISQGLLDGFKALGLEAYYAVPKQKQIVKI